MLPSISGMVPWNITSRDLSSEVGGSLCASKTRHMFSNMWLASLIDKTQSSMLVAFHFDQFDAEYHRHVEIDRACCRYAPTVISGVRLHRAELEKSLFEVADSYETTTSDRVD